uniref:TP53-regulated inhibitor of apoptosis 1 n=2 Tax=Sarcoptes scabiei TaxID=52283 RepID=A0A834REY9_SARSC
MESIGKECIELKREYDQCFNVWFAEKFLKGDHKSTMCDSIFSVYQQCVRNAIKNQNIDLLQLEKNMSKLSRKKLLANLKEIDSMIEKIKTDRQILEKILQDVYQKQYCSDSVEIISKRSFLCDKTTIEASNSRLDSDLKEKFIANEKPNQFIELDLEVNLDQDRIEEEEEEEENDEDETIDSMGSSNNQSYKQKLSNLFDQLNG